MVDLSRALDIPIAHGETMFLGLEYYPQYLIRHAEGLTATLKLAHMGQGFNANCEAHSYGTTLSQAA